MGYVTPEELQKAREVDAFSYLKTYMPGELIDLGNGEFCTKTHDSLKLSHGKWFWWSRGFGGHTALDYLVKVEEMSLTSAVRLINGRAGFIPPSPVSKREKPKIMYAPKHNYVCKTVRAYLHKRCISDQVIDFFIQKKMLAEDDKTGYCLFFGNDEKGRHKQGAVRATDGRDFKKEIFGSDKSYSFHIDGDGEKKTVRVFESAIDLMSFATLMQKAGKDFRAENMISVSGVYKPKEDIENSKVPVSLMRYLDIHPDIEKVLLHLDNDNTGLLAAKGITAALSSKYEVKAVPPPSGKDFNAYLCFVTKQEFLKEKKEKERV